MHALHYPTAGPDAFAQALLRLLADPDLARAMGQRGLEMVDEFGARKMVDDIERLYEHLLTRKRR